jgi:F-type H+-transporting ATPase subunit epsilon
MKLSIVTPESLVFAGTVDSVVLPGSEGQLGVLPGHACLVTLLQPGELSYREAGQDHYLVVGDGFIEVSQQKVIVLTDLAAKEREIDESLEEQALARAKKALAEADHTPEEEAAVRATIAKSMAKLAFKRKHH